MPDYSTWHVTRASTTVSFVAWLDQSRGIVRFLTVSRFKIRFTSFLVCDFFEKDLDEREVLIVRFLTEFRFQIEI